MAGCQSVRHNGVPDLGKVTWMNDSAVPRPGVTALWRHEGTVTGLGPGRFPSLIAFPMHTLGYRGESPLVSAIIGPDAARRDAPSPRRGP